MRTLLILLASCLSLRAAISFDGVAFASVSDAPSLNFTNSISFYASALKRGNQTVDSHFVFGKGTSGYNYSCSYATVGITYAFESRWNTPALFERRYDESTPGVVTNVWLSPAFNHNWGSDNFIFYNNGGQPVLTCGSGGCNQISAPLAEPMQIAKGRGGYEPWAGIIGEIAIWNTNLTSRQLHILSASKIKGMARQIRPTNLVLHLTMDNFPAGSSLAGTNIIRDYSGKNNHASPITNPLSHPESYASYYPNE